ncbi:MAG: S8 family peptidase [Elusimicrobia bacterium]|nr:S8 family peptidase [Elusimicrobiota bacterium]
MRAFNLGIAVAALVGALAAAPARASSRVDFDNETPSARELVSSARRMVRADKGEEPAGAALGAQAVDDQVERRIVVFQKGTDQTQRLNMVRSLGGVPTKNLWLVNAVAVVAPKSRMAAFDSKAKGLGDILRVERDYIQNWLVGAPAALPPAARALPMPRAAEEPAEGTEPEPQGQTVPWGIDRVHAKQAWEVTRGAGVKVAIVDTGVDMDHPDLKLAGGFNAIDNAVSYKDDHGHGTHVAGTVAGQDNDQDVVGIAPDVALYGVKVLSGSGSGTFADVIAGIQWTVENKMDVANFSLGAGSGTEALQDAVKAAAAAGVAIIAAAGNSGGSVGFPGAYPEVICIAASDSSDKVASFSSRGPEVDFIAPGVGVNSTKLGGGTTKMSGTSMATPHVAGLAALAVARGARGVEAVRKALAAAAGTFPDVPAEQQGGGMIDAGRLVR